MSRKYIRIDETRVKNSQTLVSKLSFSNDVKKYFQSSLFFAKYDVDIQNLNSSILNIPVVADIIPVAWAIGADILVEKLDKTFLQSLDKIKYVMKKWYPQFSFSTTIHAENIVINKFSNEHKAMLFSGGLDSTCSYIECKHEKPLLIMIWGADIPLIEKKFWRKTKETYKQFAKEENIRIRFIKTNMRQLQNEKRLTNDFGKFLTQHSWWGAVQHGVGLLGLCAPLTAAAHITTLLIASSSTPDSLRHGKRWGSHPLIDNKLSWANIRVIHHGANLSRQEKIRYLLKDYIETHKRYPVLRVCYSQFREPNCGKCEKCLRTITGLILEDIDPKKCGFNIGKDFFIFLKKSFWERRHNFYLGDKYGLWNDIQRHIPNKLSNDMYNSKEFFEWFRDFDLSEKLDRRNLRYWWSLILARLPESMSRFIVRFSDVVNRALKRKYVFL